MVDEIVTPDAAPAKSEDEVVVTPEAKLEQEKVAAEAAKKTAEEAAKNAVPEKYDFKMPEKTFLTQAQVDEIAAYSKAQGLSQEKAQSLLERENKVVHGIISSHAKGGSAWNAQVSEWEAKSLADPELGGGDKATLQKNAELGKRVIQKFGDKELVDNLLDGAGFGSHPAVLRFVTRIGKAMGEDQLVLPGASPAGKRSMEDVFYGTPPSKQ